MIFKCKPCYNFQSIEFDYNINPNTTDQDLACMFELYEKVIKGLIEISPEQPDKVRKAPTQPLISDSQKKICDNYGIKYTSKTTQEEASKLIKDSIAKYKAMEK